MRALSSAVLVSLLAVGLSGCLGIGVTPKAKDEGEAIPETPLSPVWEKVRAALANTPCQAPSVSNTATSANIRPLGAFRPTPVGIYGPPLIGELDVLQNRTILAHANQIGFTMVNVTDPMAPRLQAISPILLLASGPVGQSSFFLPPQTHDVKFSSLGTNVFMGLQDRLLIMDVTGPFIRYNYLTGMVTFPASYRGQAHMLATQVIDNAEYVFIVPGQSGTGVLVAKVLGSGLQARYEVVTVYQTPTPSPANPLLAPHDVQFRAETVNGINHTYAYFANGFGGILVMNVDDPSRPTTVVAIPAGAGELPTSALPTYYHSIRVATVDGRRIVATSSEAGYNTLKVWDLTDFRAPKLLGQWMYDATQPAKPQHGLQIVNGTILLGHHTEGLFGFDVRALLNDTKAGLKPVLHYQPQGGQILDVSVADGIIYVSDPLQGMQALGYGCFKPGDPALSSRA